MEAHRYPVLAGGDFKGWGVLNLLPFLKSSAQRFAGH
jgi:hypothetical protein